MYKRLKVCIIGNGFHSKRIQKILRLKKIKFFIFKPKSKKNYKNENLNFLGKFNVFFIISPNKTHYHYIKTLHKNDTKLRLEKRTPQKPSTNRFPDPFGPPERLPTPSTIDEQSVQN